MQQRLFLSRFSQPQAVFLLLIWLRLFISGSVLIAYGLIEWLAQPAIKSLFDWPLILLFVGLNIGHGLLAISFRNRILGNRHLLLALLVDISCWSGLMFASGGAINPAISYLLVLLSVAALALRPFQAVAVAIYMILAYSWLMQQQGHIHHQHMFEWHLWGMWLLFLMNALIMLAVIALLSRTIREKDSAIARYREQMVRDEQLLALGTQAANVAHELGTPLSTIAVLVDDIETEDRGLIQQQLQRCKQALEQLKHIDGANEQTLEESGVLFQRLQKEIALLKPGADITWYDNIQRPLLVCSMLEQALLALINNAIEAAEQQVEIKLQRIEMPDPVLQWDIQHDGENISDDLLRMLGQQVVASDKNGLGIGYYLANASIEQLGGHVQIYNLSQGVRVRITLPLLEELQP